MKNPAVVRVLLKTFSVLEKGLRSMAGEEGPFEQELKLSIGMIPANTTFVVFFVERLTKNLGQRPKYLFTASTRFVT